jgi:hypothetical protein
MTRKCPKYGQIGVAGTSIRRLFHDFSGHPTAYRATMPTQEGRGNCPGAADILLRAFYRRARSCQFREKMPRTPPTRPSMAENTVSDIMLTPNFG